MPGAGQLKKRVMFQVEKQTPDDMGGYENVWVDDLEVWGGFRPERGRERIEASRLESALAGMLTIRSSTASRALTEAHRVIIDCIPYQVRSISNEDQHNKYLSIVVERGVAT